MRFFFNSAKSTEIAYHIYAQRGGSKSPPKKKKRKKERKKCPVTTLMRQLWERQQPLMSPTMLRVIEFLVDLLVSTHMAKKKWKEWKVPRIFQFFNFTYLLDDEWTCPFCFQSYYRHICILMIIKKYFRWCECTVFTYFRKSSWRVNYSS